MKNVMLDIETLSSNSYAVIVSIGALEFDLETGKTGKEFYNTIDLQSCLDLGLEVTGGTILWWLQQSEKARMSLVKDTKPIIEVLNSFSSFVNQETILWGNSARFDCGILQNAFNKAGMNIPWDFRKERCVRTLLSFMPGMKNECKHSNTHHALDDCYFQVEYCSKIWNELNV